MGREFRPKRFWPWARFIVVPVLVLIGAVLLITTLLLLPPVRATALSRALRHLRAAVPGELTITRGAWVSLNEFEFTNMVWTDGDTLLAHIDTLAFEVDWLALLRKDIRLKSLGIIGVTADLPALANRFPPDSSTVKPSLKESESAFPRRGSLLGLPSFAAEHGRISVESLALADSAVIGPIGLLYSVDVLHGHTPTIWADQLQLRGPAGFPSIRSGRVAVDLAEGTYEAVAAGMLAEDLSFSLRVDPTERHSTRIVLTEHPDETPPDVPGLVADCEFLWRDGMLVEIAFTGLLTSPGTADLSRRSQLSEVVRTLPKLDGLQARFEGSIAFLEQKEAHASIEVTRNNWLEGGTVEIHYSPEGMRIDTLGMRLPGLAIAATARLDTIVYGHLVLDGKGTRILELLAPTLTPPQELAFHLDLVVEGSPKAPEANASFAVVGAMGGFKLDKLTLKAHTSRVTLDPITFDLQAAAYDHQLAFNGALETDDSSITISLAPVVVRSQSQRFPAPEPSHTPGTIIYRASLDQVVVENLGILGDVGEASVAGMIDLQEGGNAMLRWDWPRMPTMLSTALFNRSQEAQASTGRWATEGPFYVEVQGNVDGRQSLRRMRIQGHAQLPGPGEFQEFFPDVVLDGMGSLAMDFGLTMEGTSFDSIMAGWVDFSSVGWLDSGAARIHRVGDTIGIDSVRILGEGFEIEGSATQTSGSIAGTVHVSVDRIDLAKRMIPSMSQSSEGALQASGSFAIEDGAPMASGSVRAEIRSDGFSVPEVEGHALWTADSLKAKVTLPKGLIAGVLGLENMSADYSGVWGSDPLKSGRIVVQAEGSDLAFFERSDLERAGDTWRVAVDTLGFRVFEQELGTTQPAEFMFAPQDGRVTARKLELKGTAGRVFLDGGLEPGKADLRGEIDIRLPAKPELLGIPSLLASSRIDGEIEAVGYDSVRTWLRVTDLQIAGEPEPTVEAQTVGGGGRTAVTAWIERGGKKTFSAQGLVPGALVLWEPSFRSSEGELKFGVSMNALRVPLGMDTQVEERNAEYAIVDGNLVLTGTMQEPTAVFSADAVIPGNGDLVALDLKLLGLLIPQGAAVPELEFVDRSLARRIRLSPSESRGAIGLAMDASRGGRSLLTAWGTVPVDLKLIPLELHVSKEDSVEVSIESPGFDLSELSGMLPRDTALRGGIDFQVNASGPAYDPTLSGLLTGEEIQVLRLDGTKVHAESRLKLVGTLRKPELSGDITIVGGVIVIPEMPRELHPIEGEALLWPVLVDSLSNAGDDASASRKELSTSKGTPAIRPKVNISVLVPRGLWIRGRDLNVELAGDLRVQFEDVPVILGILRAVQGRFILFGRAFTLEAGEVTFYGTDEVNPDLNIRLTSRIDETTFRVTVAGTLFEPEITLSSEPDMDQGDIISYLVLGKPMDQLTSDQLGLVQDRLLEVAAMRGAAELQQVASRELGIDLLRIRSDDEGGGESLVVGKYLNPRLLLGYEYALTSTGTNFITLEYFISEIIRIKTWTGSQGSTSALLTAKKEY